MHSPLAAGALAALLVLGSLFESATAVAFLADGNYFQAGNISPTFRWQASGLLSEGRCPRKVVGLRWGTCYTSCVAGFAPFQRGERSDECLANTSAGSWERRATCRARRRPST